MSNGTGWSATIRVTKDILDLSRVGGDEYARRYAGVTLEVDIKADGWAYTETAKFPPNVFVTLAEQLTPEIERELTDKQLDWKYGIPK